jgi:CRP-like cAMP-binding protein
MDVSHQLRHWRLRKHQTAAVLDGIELFSGCTVRQLRLIAPRVCPLFVAPGRVLVRNGDRSDQLILVVDGEGEHTNPPFESGVLGPGSLIGEGTIAAGNVETATVTATTSMELLVVTRGELAQIISVAPAVEQRLRARLATSVEPDREPTGPRASVRVGRREEAITNALRALRRGAA